MPTPSLFVPFVQSAPLNDAASASTVIDPRLSRTSYYDGRLLRASDLVRDQQYVDARLREVGRALGQGVSSGLTLTLAQQLLTVQPGVATTQAGRVLRLDRPLSVNLANRAQLQTINNISNGRLPTGMYAVVLRLAEAPRGVAEVFPADLSARQKPRPDAIVEGVTLDLIKLDTPLPRLGAVQARAQLGPSLAGSEPSQLPEDGVALGVLAIQDDQPAWLDQYLLRHPPRGNAHGAHSADLALHYRTLFGDIRSSRTASGLPELDWAAREYFSRLPPVGPLPKASVNPAEAWQAFFPGHWSVHVAPVREDDWAELESEALALEPLELASSLPYQVLILARLSGDDFARYAPQLDDRSGPGAFPTIDPLLLRFAPRAALEAALDTDSVAWAKIWAAVQPEGVWYVRRAPRAAQSQVMAVLANGIAKPAATVPAELPAPTSDSLAWSSIEALLQTRVPAGDGTAAATAQLVLEAVTEDHTTPDLRLAITSLALNVDRRFDAALWPTIQGLLQASPGDASSLNVLASKLRSVPRQGTSTELTDAITQALAAVGITDAASLKSWHDLVSLTPA